MRAAALPDAVIAVWSHTVQARAGVPTTAWVPPDGCQDLIGVVLPDGTVQWHVFPLAAHASEVPLLPDTRVLGYRLYPGTRIDSGHLLESTRGLDAQDEQGALQRLAQCCTRSPRVQEALEAIACRNSVARAAASLGVSERSLQRLLLEHTGQSPVFWKGLARLRQSAHSLALSELPLAHVADMHAYADQAHMNRAYRHWLGCSPGEVRHHPQRLALLRQSGYA